MGTRQKTYKSYNYVNCRESQKVISAIKKKKKEKKKKRRSSHRGAVKTNLTRNHEVVGSIPGLAQLKWVKDPALL